MTVLEMLQADGLSAEEIKALTENPKYAQALENMRQKAEQGETALQNANKIKEDMEKFMAETVNPYGLKKDQEAAEARAELAKTQAYLKSLKDSGYDIPDAYLNGTGVDNTTATVDKPSLDTSEYIKKSDLDSQGKAYMSLLSMSERARDLLGHGLDIEQEYEDFGKNRRPNENLREYVSRKYELDAKAQAKAAEKAAAERKAIEDAAIEKYKAEHPESSSPDLVVPRPSKFDRLANLDSERKQLFQTKAGRDQATRDRIAKYTSMVQ